MAGYSVDLRRSIARIHSIQGDDTAMKAWQAKAADVSKKVKAALWRPELSAMYDRYADDTWVSSLQHNNLRMMWLGAFDQEMADAFIADNLMNTSRFWTKMPMPSIAVSDPHFEDRKGNNWSGPSEGLTLQRAIRALEAYGHHAESVLAGLALTQALLNGCKTPKGCAFPQQIDPLTAIPEPGDGYGPMIMSLLEYTARRVGIVPLPQGEGGALLFSAAYNTTGVSTRYDQMLGDSVYSLRSKRMGGRVTASGELAGASFFNVTATAPHCDSTPCDHVVGVRVIVSAATKVTAVVGISDTPVTVSLSLAAGQVSFTVKPNEEWSIVAGGGKLKATLAKSTPFSPPHG